VSHHLAIVILVATCAACGGEDVTPGRNEPFRVTNGNAQFFSGKLPGTPAAQAAEGAKPSVKAFDFANKLVTPGETGKNLNGRASDDTTSIGLAAPGISSGYWVVPVGAPDPQFPGEITWSARADFSPDFPAGTHEFVAVPFDKDGKAGVQKNQSFCILPRIPDNGHACDPSRPLPAAVAVLRWNRPVDLDLQVVTPTGRVVTPKNPTVDVPDLTDPFNPIPPNPDLGIIDHDGGRECVSDALMQEALVFVTPPRGAYTFYANLFDSCGVQGLSFELSIWVPRGTGDAQKLTQARTYHGRATSLDANGGTGNGLRMARITF
jgi:hypothetical protein